MEKQQSRRIFLKQSAITTVGIATGLQAFGIPYKPSVLGANDKIRMGFIGIGNRGTQLMHQFMDHPDCEVAALCDVYQPFMSRNRSAVNSRYLKDLGGLIPQMGENFPSSVKTYPDYRDMLDDKSIDAVCISTPDHWHALQTIHAIHAGKDVYVEKPLTMTVREGRSMVNAEKGSKQIVAVGLNKRGSVVYQKLAREVSAGKIGKVTFANASRVSNMFPAGIGKMQPQEPPGDFDWDSWLGPRAYRPYQYNIAPYYFRWWSEYSSQMGNWGVHFMDVIRWMMGEQAPVAISAHGGKYIVDDDRDIPDTMHVTYEFASGAIISFSILEASSNRFIPYGEVELRGTDATLFADENGYRIIPTTRGQFQSWERLTDTEEFTMDDEQLADGSSRNSSANLVRNFLDCVKSRKTPFCTLEDGHRSTCFSHLANIALATEQRLKWDSVNERFTNSEEANKLLHYEYRKPYKL
jgi:predicted dehydrogenase